LRGARGEPRRAGGEGRVHRRARSGAPAREIGRADVRHRHRHRPLEDHRGRRLVVGRGGAGGVRAPGRARGAQGLWRQDQSESEIDMSIRWGVSPIAWANDDMPELGGDTPLETILAEIRDVGFEGVELGGKFPREPGALKAALAPFGLACIGGWYSGNLLARDAAAELEALQPHLRLLKAMGSNVFVFAETSNAVHGDRRVPLEGSPR